MKLVYLGISSYFIQIYISILQQTNNHHFPQEKHARFSSYVTHTHSLSLSRVVLFCPYSISSLVPSSLRTSGGGGFCKRESEQNGVFGFSFQQKEDMCLICVLSISKPCFYGIRYD